VRCYGGAEVERLSISDRQGGIRMLSAVRNDEGKGTQICHGPGRNDVIAVAVKCKYHGLGSCERGILVWNSQCDALKDLTCAEDFCF
jgi:hypothetical protein